MPTLAELRREQPSPLNRKVLAQFDEEVIADSRANLRPSQVVDKKLESRTTYEYSASRSPAFRLRAK